MSRAIIVPLVSDKWGENFLISSRTMDRMGSLIPFAVFVPEVGDKTDQMVNLIGVVAEAEEEEATLIVFLLGGHDKAEELYLLLEPHALGNKVTLLIERPFDGGPPTRFTLEDIVQGDLLSGTSSSETNN